MSLFGSGWGQSNTNQPQQPQQPQQPGGFGQSNAFGSGGAFGTSTGTNAFGQPQQPQQPQQQPQQQQQPGNTMFGSFGQTNPAANPGGTSAAFGTFGSANTGGAFGAPKPANTFAANAGAFGGGGTSTFGSTGGAFGSGAGATSSFNQPSTSTGTFGTGTTAFGTQPSTGAFGAAAAPTANPDGTVPPITTGSVNPPYSVFSEKDSSSANSNITLQYQAISCMPPYRGTSFEEIRVYDYAQGRKTASAAGAGGAFGSFGQPSTSTTGAFGAQPATSTSTSSFGFGTQNTAAGTSAFGGAGAGGAFGQANPTQPAGATGSIFGGGTTGAFGTQQPGQQQPGQQQPAATSFGFGQQQQQPQQAQPNAFGTGAGLFGQQQQQQANKPAFGFGTGANTGTATFGASPSTTGAFGQPSTAQQPATSNIFGQPAQQQQQQQQPQQTSAFGFGATNQPKPGGLFGSTGQPAQGAASTFGFGATNQQGQPGTQPATTGTGAFGGGGLFGNNQGQQTPAPAGNSLFGNAQPQQQPATNAFGGGGLFGGQNQQNQQPPGQQANAFGTNNLFGAKPATTAAPSLFGNATNTASSQPATGGLFGTNLTAQPVNNSTNAFGGSLFGNNNRPQTTFGAQPMQNNVLGATSLFGGNQSTLNASTIAPNGQQGSLTASIAQPIGANLPIFDMLPPGPRVISLEPPKKKSSFLADIPTRSPVPRLQLGWQPVTSKLRGFSSTNGQISLNSGKPNALALSRAADGLSSTQAFFSGNGSTAALGSGVRPNAKKLVLDKNVSSSDLFRNGRLAPGSLKAGAPKAVFNPVLSMAAREREAEDVLRKTTPAPVPVKKGGAHFDAQGSAASVDAEVASDGLQPGAYYSKPAVEELKKLGYEKLACFEGLVVGRVGYGEVTFCAPVNLTEVPRLRDLLGKLVRFDTADCQIYPDLDEAETPAPGSGLNVTARIEILGAWPKDKATKEPIKDPEHPLAAKQRKRLQSMAGTQFESYDVDTGRWVFSVESF